MIPRAIFQIGLLLLLPPLLLGVVNRVKARFAGRAGPPLLQLYFDLWKLLRKGTVLSRTTTWVFQAGPVVGLAAIVTAGLLVAVAGERAIFAFAGGSSFEGMGAAREVTFASLAEPALFLTLVVLARATGALSLSGMLGPGLGAAWREAAPALVLAAIALFVVALAESSRIPVDDPNTHLELTMIHEVMVLDHSGPDLALILYGAALKLFLFGALFTRVVLGFRFESLLAAEAAFVAGLLGFAALVGVVESAMARLRLVRVPQLLVGASVLSVFALVLLLR
jgi:formate hydrogenlyase subunit 4